MPDIMSKISRTKKQESDGQVSLFGDDPGTDYQANNTPTIDVDDFSLDEKLLFEKEFLGFYLTSHPHMETLANIKHIISHEIELLEGEKQGAFVKIGGIIEGLRKIVTRKSNAEMAFMSIGDEKGLSVECVVFPRVFEESKLLLINDNVVVIEGKLDSKDDQTVIIANKVYSAKNLST